VPRNLVGLVASFLIACGPARRPARDDAAPVASADAAACVPSPEGDVASCGDGLDNDCDGLPDCRDPNCSGVGDCPACGMVEHSPPQPLPLPDGVSEGVACASSATCDPSTPSCVDGSCHAAYTSTLNFAGFAPNQTFTDATNIERVCVNIEHSWLPDLEIVLRAPDGKEVELARMPGRSQIHEVYLGQANDCDATWPSAGVGADYCWTPATAMPSMITYVKTDRPMQSTYGCTGDLHQELPPGDYGIDGAWTDLVGTPLNGDWTLVVTDAWKLDNGFLFSWSIAFDPALVHDCTGPIQ
jgi:subtilisin-like proprotein convertase family protein